SGEATFSTASCREIALFASPFVDRAFFAVAAVVAIGGCAPPRVVPLQGAPVPAQQLPKGTPPHGHREIEFRWEMHDGELNRRGDGVARIASPDSVRLDFFLG